jgi:hypothetical protein
MKHLFYLLQSKYHTSKTLPLQRVVVLLFLCSSLVACKSQRQSRPSYGLLPQEIHIASVTDSIEAISTRNTVFIPAPSKFSVFQPSVKVSLTEPVCKPNRQYLTDLLNPLDMEDDLRDSLVTVARRYLGTRYRSAGKTPRGFDCSGFTGFIYGKFGIKLPPCSAMQARVGEQVSIREARKGDLVFFGYKRGRKKRSWTRVNHAGIVISEPGEPLRIIHSASRRGVIISTVNYSRYWQRRLLFTRSVIDEKLSEKILN